MIGTLSPEMIAERRERRRQAIASFAIEGIEFTPEDLALFDEFDREGLSADEQIARIKDYLRRRYAHFVAAE